MKKFQLTEDQKQLKITSFLQRNSKESQFESQKQMNQNQQKVVQDEEKQILQSLVKTNQKEGNQILNKESTTKKYNTFLLPYQYKKTWEFLSKKLENIKNNEIKSCTQFIELIRSFIAFEQNCPMQNVNINLLSSFFANNVSQKEQQYFINNIIPFMATLALEQENLFPHGLQKLLQNQNQSISLTKKQVCCLIVLMFLCIIRSPKNFSQMFKSGFSKSESKVNKIACFYNYFKRCSQSLDESINVCYSRSSFNFKIHNKYLADGESNIFSLNFWKKSKEKLSKVQIMDQGYIEECNGDIQIDFANKKIGGGCLNQGSVQEEIRFCISPELIPSILIFEDLCDYEAAFIIGTERFTSYEGYGSGFEFGKNYIDNVQVDIFNRKDVTISAIDAQNYNNSHFNILSQFTEIEILREIGKSFIGFYGCPDIAEDEIYRKKIATGRWGCGAFGGDSQLKFCIQWISASKVNRSVKYFRFQDDKLATLSQYIIQPYLIIWQVVAPKLIKNISF